MSETGAAMERDQWYRIAATHDFVPDLAARDIDVALFHRASELELRVIRRCGFRGSGQQNKGQRHEYRTASRTRALTEHNRFLSALVRIAPSYKLGLSFLNRDPYSRTTSASAKDLREATAPLSRLTPARPTGRCS